MSFIDRFKRKEVPVELSETRSTEADYFNNLVLGTLSWNTTNSLTSYKEANAMKLSAVYRAVAVISDSVAVLPLDTYEYKSNWKFKKYDNLYYLLNVQPNKVMSAYTFKKQIVQYILLKGNAYVMISRDKKTSEPIQFDLINPDYITVVMNEDGTKGYNYKSNTREFQISDDDMIHIMNYSLEGLVGISTLSYASMTLETAYNSEDHANQFFKGGGNMSGILSPKAGVNITAPKAAAAKTAFQNASNIDVGGKSNSIVVLDSGLDYQPITISPKDAQLLESRAFNFITIAQFFGVSPHKLFDYSKASYSSVEASQIDFLNTTLQPLLEKIELEIYRKVYSRVEYAMTELKFDVENLLRMDSAAKATYFSQMFQVGAYTPNEIRSKINGDYPIKGGNRGFIQVNVQPVDNLISEQVVVDDPAKQIDNKLKKDNDKDNDI